MWRSRAGAGGRLQFRWEAPVGWVGVIIIGSPILQMRQLRPREVKSAPAGEIGWARVLRAQASLSGSVGHLLVGFPGSPTLWSDPGTFHPVPPHPPVRSTCRRWRTCG